MTTESYDRKTSYRYCATGTAVGEIRKLVNRSGANSPFVNGTLVLRENNYSAIRFNGRRALYSLKSKTTGVITCYLQNGLPYGGSNIVLPSGEDSAKIASKLLSKWKGSDLNVGVSVGEGRESVHMISERLVALRSGWARLRKLDLAGCLRHLSQVPTAHKRYARKRLELKDVSGAWLELHLGWKPLLNDIYNAAEFKVEYQSDKKFLRARAPWQNPGYCTLGLPYKEVFYQSSGGVQYKAFLSTSVPPSTPERLGLTDPLSIAWELVPFSFVVDWFVPIGTFLEGLHGINVLPVATVTKSWKKEVIARERAAYSYLAYSQPYAIVNHNEYSEYNLAQSSRSVNQAMPSGYSLLGSVPRSIKIGFDDSLTRLGTSFALFHQIFGK